MIISKLLKKSIFRRIESEGQLRKILNKMMKICFHNKLEFSVILFYKPIFYFFCRNLDKDIEGSAKRWKKFTESEKPEREKFPQEWKNKTALQRLCMMRCLRPDRMTYAVG